MGRALRAIAGLACLLGPLPGLAQASFPLWPAGNPGGWKAPGSERSEAGKDGVLRVSNVEAPTLTEFAPVGMDRKDATIVICPGGGYRILAMDLEGEEVARWLAARGFRAFVLKYRLPRPGEVRYAAALQDVQRALRVVRVRSPKSARIGLLGFSAGAHLAAVAASQWKHPSYPVVDEIDRSSCRPDFLGLVYPAYLLPEAGKGALAPELAPEAGHPATFLVHAADDPVPPRNSVAFSEVLRGLKVPVELHLFGEGGHGYGLRQAGKLPVGQWPGLFEAWLSSRSSL